METNPMQVARPLVGPLPGDLGVGVGSASRQILNSVETLRGGVNAQGAGAWHKLFFNAPPEMMGSVHVPLPGPLPDDKVAALAALGEKYGVPHIADSGTGVTLTKFGGDTPSGIEMGKLLKKKGGLGDQLKDLLGDAGGGVPQRAYVDSGYIPLYHSGEEGVPHPAEGSGIVTRKMLGALDPLPPQMQQNLAGAIRPVAYGNMQRDAELAAMTGQRLRPDIQNLREILSRPGDTWQALREALASGKVSLPAIMGLLGGGAAYAALPGSLSASPGQQQQRVY
jgi:hypothetical protein